jgi:hypothetical protein
MATKLLAAFNSMKCYNCNVYIVWKLRLTWANWLRLKTWPAMSSPYSAVYTTLWYFYYEVCFNIVYNLTSFFTLSLFIVINQTDASISQIYFVMKLYMFRTVPLSSIRSSFTIHSAMVYVIQLTSRIRMEHPDPARKLSTNLYDMYHCWVYSE